MRHLHGGQRQAVKMAGIPYSTKYGSVGKALGRSHIHISVWVWVSVVVRGCMGSRGGVWYEKQPEWCKRGLWGVGTLRVWLGVGASGGKRERSRSYFARAPGSVPVMFGMGVVRCCVAGDRIFMFKARMSPSKEVCHIDSFHTCPSAHTLPMHMVSNIGAWIRIFVLQAEGGCANAPWRRRINISHLLGRVWRWRWTLPLYSPWNCTQVVWVYSQVAELIQQRAGFPVAKKVVHFEESLSRVRCTVAEIRLHKDVVAKMKVVVVPATL